MATATKNGKATVQDQDLNETKRKLVSKSAVRVIPLASIKADPSYQRDVKAKHKRIVANFNKDAFGVPLVAEREDGSLWVVDGLQRITAVGKLGHTTVRAEVFRSDGPEQEAEIFKLINMHRLALTAVEQYRALLTAGDELAWSVKEAVEECGFHIPSGRSGDKGGWKHITAIKALLWFARDHGTDGIKFALNTIKEVWPEDRMGNSHNILSGLAEFYVRKEGAVDLERLYPRLRKVTPSKILYTASQDVVWSNRFAAVAAVLERLYAKRMKAK